jgi:hypothetical protein
MSIRNPENETERKIRENFTLKIKLDDAPEELIEKVYDYYDSRDLQRWSREKLEREYGLAKTANHSSASSTPDYVEGYGSPRSIALQTEMERRRQRNEEETE